MKKPIAALALMAAGAANAGTINLGEEACTSTNICFNVPNDAGLTINYIDDATRYGRLLISINGEIYDSGLYLAYGTNIPLYAVDGTVIYATVNIQVRYGTCIREGRVTECPKYVTLLGGTLVTP